MDNQTKNKKQQELVMSRIFSVPREEIWKAWTEPDMAKKWWGPREFTAPVIQIDLRVGGKYVNCMRSPDGIDYWGTGVYKEVSPPKRLVLTDSFADEKGNIVSAAFYGMDIGFPMESIITVTLDEVDGKTKFTMKYDDVSAMKDEDLQGMKLGWSESFDKLEEYLSRQELS